MKYFILIISIVFFASCDGKTGPEGPQGPKGEKGDPGADGTEITAAQVLEKIVTVDGTGSGLDADTLDGVEYAVIETAIQTAQTKADTNETNITAVNTAIDNRPYVFDGNGRELGPLVSVTADSVIYWDADLDIPVEAYRGSLKNAEDIRGNQDVWLYCSEVDCSCDLTGALKKQFSTENIGLLASSGKVFTADGPGSCASLPMKSRRNTQTGVCENTGDVTEEFCSYASSKTIDPFTPGVTVGKR